MTRAQVELVCAEITADYENGNRNDVHTKLMAMIKPELALVVALIVANLPEQDRWSFIRVLEHRT